MLWSFRSSFFTYTSPSKIAFERVAKAGCQFADAASIYTPIQDNIRSKERKNAFGDIEQTCEAFRKHFDRAAAAQEFAANFPFCLHFYMVRNMHVF